MATPNPLAGAVSEQVLRGVERQLDELQAPPVLTWELAKLRARLDELGDTLAALPADANIDAQLISIRAAINGVIDGSLPHASLGEVLSDVLSLEPRLNRRIEDLTLAGAASA